jgi:hypothetical protein
MSAELPRDEFGTRRPADDLTYRRLSRTPEPNVLTERLRGAAVFLEAVRDANTVGEGSGFVVRVPNLKDGYVDDFVVVTARHNVAGAERRGAAISVVIHDGERRAAFRIAMPHGSWFHGAHDVSVGLLPIAKLGLRSDFLPVPPSEFSWRLPEISPVHTQLYAGAKWATIHISSFERRGSKR